MLTSGPQVLSRRGRRARALATAAVLVALLAGTVAGDDDHFPFGPFRMYSTTNALDGEINTVRFKAVTLSGEELEPRAQDFGLRPAEVNGQVGRFVRDPSLLGHLARAYTGVHPEREPLAEIVLAYGWHTLRDGRPVAYREEELVRWSAP